MAKQFTFITCTLDGSCAKCDSRMVVSNQPIVLCAAPSTSDKKKPDLLLFPVPCVYRGTLTININEQEAPPPEQPGKN